MAEEKSNKPGRSGGQRRRGASKLESSKTHARARRGRSSLGGD